MMEDEGTLDTLEYALINLVRSYPELYNHQSAGHRDKSRRDRAWGAIAKQLNRDETWCYSKWRNLIDYYKKRKRAYDTGTTRTSQRWVYYDAMSFLDLCDNNRDALGSILEADHSLSSIRSANEQIFEDGSNNQNYFDETQYQSLDGIAERATTTRDALVEVEPRVNPLQDPLSDCPPVKRQRMKQLATDEVHRTEHATNLLDMPGPSSQNNVNSKNCPSSDSISQVPRIVKVRSKEPIVSSSVADPDCPHYLFCMSLAARFKKMEPSTATYIQMKIMEVFLKSEAP